jgi:hypothetical protein
MAFIIDRVTRPWRRRRLYQRLLRLTPPAGIITANYWSLYIDPRD